MPSRTQSAKKFLRRYTDIPALIYLLREQKITLLSPSTWDDGNDREFMTLYQGRKRLKSLLALCFSQSDETYHHWRVFAPGAGGVCVAFDRNELVKTFKTRRGVRMGAVEYLKIGELRGKRIAVSKLPFLKRYAYAHESEFRLLYESTSVEAKTLDVPIPLSCIRRITLSPWIPGSLFSRVKDTLKSIPGCEGAKIYRSTLIGNEEWKKLGSGAKGK